MHEKYLSQAIELACDNVKTGNGGPYAALVVKDGEVLSESGNCVTSDNDPTAHAEVMAIRLACRKLNDFQLTGCTLYTSCEPCPMCLGAIYWARLDKVFFACNRFDAAAAGFDDSFIYDEIGREPLERQILMQHLNLETAQKPFQLWALQLDKVLY